MQKLLLATTALVASTSFAMADIELSGTAQAGIAAGTDTTSTTDDNDGEAHVYSGVDLTFTFTTTSDAGVEAGASVDIDAKSSWYDIGDFEFDTDNMGTGDYDISFGSVHLAYQGFKATFDDGGIDNLYDDDKGSHDLQLEFMTGGFGVYMTHDVDGDSGDAESSFKLSYAMDGLSASVTGDTDDDCTVINVGYASGPFTVGVESDQGCGTQVNTLSASYSMDAFTISGEVDDADGWEFGVGFSQDGLSVNASTDHDDEWELTGMLDTGGGVYFVAGVNHAEAWYLGTKVNF